MSNEDDVVFYKSLCEQQEKSITELIGENIVLQSLNSGMFVALILSVAFLVVFVLAYLLGQIINSEIYKEYKNEIFFCAFIFCWFNGSCH